MKEHNINKNYLEKLIFEVKNEEKEKLIKEDFETRVNFNSPLFDIISKTKNFENNYTIYIDQYYIDEYDSNKKHKSFFNKLNKLKVNYSSIYYHNDNSGNTYKNNTSLLKRLNIDFNKIKRMTFHIYGKYYSETKAFSFFHNLF